MADTSRPHPAEVIADPGFKAARRAAPIDAWALSIARRTVEDVLVELRDRGISTASGNGLVIRERDGRDSRTMRLSTEEALDIGIGAYLAALDVANPKGGSTQLLSLPRPDTDHAPGFNRADLARVLAAIVADAPAVLSDDDLTVGSAEFEVVARRVPELPGWQFNAVRRPSAKGTFWAACAEQQGCTLDHHHELDSDGVLRHELPPEHFANRMLED